MFQAKDVMTTHVVAIDVDDTVDRAISLMVRHRISGLPVCDEQGRPVGVVSEFDLLELICEGHSETSSVRDYMSKDLCAVKEEDSWVHIVDVFRSRRVRRLPVLRGDELVGIVTRHDLMHAIRDARQQIRQNLTVVRQAAGHDGSGSAMGRETRATLDAESPQTGRDVRGRLPQDRPLGSRG